MATVNATYRLASDVKEIIRKAYIPRLDELRSEIDKLFSFDVVVDAYIESTGGKELFESVKHWFREDSDFFLESLNGIQFGTRLRGPDRVMPCMPRVLNLPALDQVLEDRKVLLERYKVLQVECNSTENNVISALEAYPSVNSAIKANPQLEMLLPQWAKDKIAQKAVKNKVEVELNVDISNAAAIGVMSRLASAAT